MKSILIVAITFLGLSGAEALSMEETVAAQLMIRTVVEEELLGNDYPDYDDLKSVYMYELIGQSNEKITDLECDSSLNGKDTCFVSIYYDDGIDEALTVYRIEFKSGKINAATIEDNVD